MSYSKTPGNSKGKKLGHEKDKKRGQDKGEQQPISRPRIHEMIRCGVDVEEGKAQHADWKSTRNGEDKGKKDKGKK